MDYEDEDLASGLTWYARSLEMPETPTRPASALKSTGRDIIPLQNNNDLG
jgi:hypothetical protein